MDSLVVSGLTKKYKDLIAVDNISLNIKKGSIFAFLGPNGAGKSTSINMFTTLLKPTSGSIMIEGIDVLEEQDDARRHFAVVFQDRSSDDELTAYENLKIHAILYDVPADEMEKRINDALHIIGLEDRKKDFVKTFSGGMKRRLEIGRALIHYPKVLFLDEPTTGLDPQTREAIWSYLKEMNKKRGTTIFFTTQYMSEAEEVAQEVAIIDHGKIIAQGTVKEINKKAKAKNLEQAFLKLTGRSIRDERVKPSDRMWLMRKFR
jgi:ABC-2 type transport system ATP-binding protein